MGGGCWIYRSGINQLSRSIYSGYPFLGMHSQYNWRVAIALTIGHKRRVTLGLAATKLPICWLADRVVIG